MRNKIIALFALTLLFSITACKDNKQNDMDGDETVTETGLDSISDVGSDGLGREIDTVSEIERDVNDNLDEDAVAP
ncbi:hypothetical protein [Flavobacterium sp.]|uniref:hypothetical protein n=1 Tax=Flavobacterium sp. TaxID=239 RepID=UPI002617A6D6|nr:hypothetical protein [Flavobacterium sp.]